MSKQVINAETGEALDDETQAMLRQMFEQMIIVFAKREGGEMRIPVSEVDATGDSFLSMSVDQEAGEFVFKALRKS